MNNDENKRKQPFEVHIIDDDDMLLDPSQLDELTPEPAPQKKKFEVHIDENSIEDYNPDDQRPRYNGEVYFSNRKPIKPRPVETRESEQPRQVTPVKKTAKKAVDSAFAVFCAAVLICTTVLSLIAISCINDVLAITRSDEDVVVTIPNDATTNEIIDILADEGLVKQKLFCKVFYKFVTTFKNINKKKPVAEPVYLSGVYYVQKNLGLEGYLTEFTETQTTDETVTLIFPEGWTIYQMFDRLDKFGVCSKDKLIASLKGTTFEYDFVSEIPNDSQRTLTLEGYFFPETYEFYEASDPNSVIRKFLSESEKRWTEEYQKQAEKLGYTRDEIIIIASIIQREAANTEQMALISSVIHNRLNHAVSWPTLGCDSTKNYITTYIAPNDPTAVNYVLPYDTYSSQGLPPGPICNPGDDAIHAALFPDDTDYYYFRHDKYGKIYMAKTQYEHDENGNKVLRANNS